MHQQYLIHLIKYNGDAIQKEIVLIHETMERLDPVTLVTEKNELMGEILPEYQGDGFTICGIYSLDRIRTDAWDGELPGEAEFVKEW